ncbi:anhydro-N-acetylmuramic acid kinase [Alsobacter metallidurans]|uniref:Anhydro-N-acetylmuramic acid kinase n=1 Tax=Alsobacter metallidurans TaxID=340221 RepID=A0A917I356_9HYPH|nr:anhydro-N-acetylmuramic acid kinase [Alsobacter metallidurans]GGH09155.1 anhydro-N-acetylmuramic acid kinase [Alsobacter metallidurans]
MSDPALLTAIGAISGTSMDGIDVSLVRTDGDARVETGPGQCYPYAPALRDQLLALIADAPRAEHGALDDLEAAVSDAHADAIAQFMTEFSVDRASVRVIGLHGQTVYHRPEKRFTRQLGVGARVARALGVDVVNRFRHADVAAGGEGAPFAPLYHRALASRLEQPVMVLNLGGVGNVTFIDGETVIAFDTGPASALLDDFVLKRLGKPYDEGGRLAGSGQADAAMVASLMKHPYFDRPAPKSLDRNDFHAWAKAVESLGDSEGAATLAAFTVASAADAVRHVPRPPVRWLVTGGGRLNATFMRLLHDALGVPVEPVEAVGWNGDFIEAQCFGYLAVRSLRGLPLSLPTTTGVPAPMTGGELWRAA